MERDMRLVEASKTDALFVCVCSTETDERSKTAVTPYRYGRSCLTKKVSALKSTYKFNFTIFIVVFILVYFVSMLGSIDGRFDIKSYMLAIR